MDVMIMHEKGGRDPRFVTIRRRASLRSCHWKTTRGEIGVSRFSTRTESCCTSTLNVNPQMNSSSTSRIEESNNAS